MSFTIKVHDNEQDPERVVNLINKRSQGQYRRWKREHNIQAQHDKAFIGRPEANIHERNTMIGRNKAQHIVDIVEILGFGGKTPSSPKDYHRQLDVLGRGFGLGGFHVVIHPGGNGQWADMEGKSSSKTTAPATISLRIYLSREVLFFRHWSGDPAQLARGFNSILKHLASPYKILYNHENIGHSLGSSHEATKIFYRIMQADNRHDWIASPTETSALLHNLIALEHQGKPQPLFTPAGTRQHRTPDPEELEYWKAATGGKPGSDPAENLRKYQQEKKRQEGEEQQKPGTKEWHGHDEKGYYFKDAHGNKHYEDGTVEAPSISHRTETTQRTSSPQPQSGTKEWQTPSPRRANNADDLYQHHGLNPWEMAGSWGEQPHEEDPVSYILRQTKEGEQVSSQQYGHPEDISSPSRQERPTFRYSGPPRGSLVQTPSHIIEPDVEPRLGSIHKAQPDVDPGSPERRIPDSEKIYRMTAGYPWDEKHPAVMRVVNNLRGFGHIQVVNRKKEGIFISPMEHSFLLSLHLSGRSPSTGFRSGLLVFREIQPNIAHVFFPLIPYLVFPDRPARTSMPIKWRNDLSKLVQYFSHHAPELINHLADAVKHIDFRNTTKGMISRTARSVQKRVGG